MELIENAAMENSEMLDEKHEPLTSAHVLSSSSFKGSDVIGNESVFYEKFLLDDLDNYWDELNDRLTVSRMVSDSIIKGMVCAVVEESAERIALKEAEILTLNEKLQSYHSSSATGNILGLHCSPLDVNLKLNCVEVCRLKLAAEEQIQRLKEDIHNIEISNSNGRLNSLPADVGLCNILPQARMHEKLMETHERVDSLGTIVEQLFNEMNETFHTMKASVSEQHLEYEIEREINSIVIQSSVRTLQNEFERKLYQQICLIDMLNMNWQQKFSELSSMREDLNSLSRSLSSSESGPLLSHNSLDNPDERNASKRKDHLPRKVLGNHHLPYTTQTEENGSTLMEHSEDCEQPMLDVADFSQLKHMSNDELVSYFKTEMIKMRRQHDSALQEKTEELFTLKREFLREKGNSLFKKDKEFELLKKKIPEVILKLDDILLEKEKPHIVQNNHSVFCSLKDSMDTILSENQHLRFLLSEKREEVNNISLQVPDATSQMLLHSSVEAKFLKQIEKLEEDLVDAKMEACIQHELHDIMLKGVISENKCVVEDIDIEARIMQDIYSTVIRWFIIDWTSTANSLILRYFSEKSSLKALLCEHERALQGEIEEKKSLKETITSLSTLMKEKEKEVLEKGSTLMQQKQQFDWLNQQIDILRKQVAMQEVQISKGKLEYDSIMQRLEEALQKIHGMELETKNLNDKLMTASDALDEAGKKIRINGMEIKKLKEKLSTAANALEEAEKQKIMLLGIIEDMDKKLLSKEKEQGKQMESIVTCLIELSKVSIDFENKVTKNIERNETRLKILSRQCSPLIQQSNLLTQKVVLCKQMLEIRSSNLQKAEAEVDLLGDEVDALLSLLGKIYIALDHYSPVLQHYPGVMEILKLVKRELEGETTRAV